MTALDGRDRGRTREKREAKRWREEEVMVIEMLAWSERYKGRLGWEGRDGGSSGGVVT